MKRGSLPCDMAFGSLFIHNEIYVVKVRWYHSKVRVGPNRLVILHFHAYYYI